ncbi:MAG: M20/M25/M40 family metallo-hydrolase [Bryobacteraceae bacterium]|jgi:Iap family predicted aminopeptidase
MKTTLIVLAAGFSAVLLSAEGLTDKYRDVANRLIDAAMADNGAMEKLTYLCDRIGNRLSGSPSLDQAIAWSAAQMKKDGLENVVTPLVKVPHWVRGAESASIVEPVKRRLTILGLGGSIATPKQGITAEVVPVANFDELESKGRAGVDGKIVLFNAPYVSYGQTVVYRHGGASRAAKLGAIAVLVRSITPLAVQLPHTGAMDYAAGVQQIPAAAVTIEDATLMQRLTDAGTKVRVHLEMEAHTEPDADSANVIGEIRGSEEPEKVVVIGGHIDSWDVGAGAQDDGSGIITSLEAAHLIKTLGLKPRRTIRVVFWVNEENGGAGGKAYREWIEGHLKDHVAAIEMDGGAEKPVGFGISAGGQTQAAVARLREVGALLDRIGAGSVTSGGGGADIAPIMMGGVPGLAMRTVGTHYFDWHHTAADTVDKIDLDDLRRNVAAMAVMTYVLADMPDAIGK